MELSKSERLILSNQYRILAKLDPDEAEYYNDMLEVLESGYELEYDWKTEYLTNDPLSKEESHEVIHILAMYDAIQRSYKALEDKSGIDPYDVKFSGFDGNNEGKQMGYARFLVQRQQKFTFLDMPADLNSHFPSLDVYRRMLPVWRGELGSKYDLSKEELQRVLHERIHPTNR